MKIFREIKITSSNNKLLKSWQKLLQNLPSCTVDKPSPYFLEGERLVFDFIRLLSENSYLIELIKSDFVLFCSETYRSSKKFSFLASALEKLSLTVSDFSLYVLNDQCFAKLSDTTHTQGLSAIVQVSLFKKLPSSFSDLGKRCLLLQNLQDPANLGSILRSASAFGFDTLICCDSCVNLNNLKVLRTAMGAVFKLKFYKCRESDFTSLCQLNRSEKVRILAGSIDGDPFSLYLKNNYCTFEDKEKRHIIMIGNEAGGLTAEIESLADYKLRLEMKENVESLNASVAMAIMAYELRLI